MVTEVRRICKLGSDGIFGVLLIDGKAEATTLERVGVEIPVGAYKLGIATDTPKAHFWDHQFQPVHHGMLHVLKVPGRTMIELHPGNYPKDSDGCVLIADGVSFKGGIVTNSRNGYIAVYPKLRAAAAKGEAELHVTEDFLWG